MNYSKNLLVASALATMLQMVDADLTVFCAFDKSSNYVSYDTYTKVGGSVPCRVFQLMCIEKGE